ncbi:hypothetical protein Q3G72_005319 [Acer saccharum]|nr:hypothetical protein Q3G72_005319 [Acer saccharum]
MASITHVALFDGKTIWKMWKTCGMALIFTLPFGVIRATTNTGPALNVISELIIGSLHENPTQIHVHCSVGWNYSWFNCPLRHNLVAFDIY